MLAEAAVTVTCMKLKANTPATRNAVKFSIPLLVPSKIPKIK